MPCRLGTTSYIIPADILPNLKFLANRVDDVELVLFESDEYSNLPSPADVARMGKIADDYGLSYTVHLPLDAWPGSADEAIRKRSLEKWFRVMERMAPLQPFAWIVHLNGLPRGDTGAQARWQDQCARSLEALSQKTDPRLLCVETLGYDYRLAWPMADENNCSVCLDIGHLVLNGYDVAAYFDAWLERTRVIHLHGVDPSSRDHKDISHLDEGLLGYILNELNQTGPVDRVMTLEVFSRSDFETSMELLERMLT